MRYTDHHQALMAVRRGEWVAAVYDGLPGKDLLEGACKVLAHVSGIVQRYEPEEFLVGVK